MQIRSYKVLAAVAVGAMIAVGGPGAVETSSAQETGVFFLRNFNSGGAANNAFSFGRDGDEPIVGDWNGDGIVTVGVRRGNRFLLRNSNTGGPAHLDFFYGRAGDQVVVGDWNGNGVDTVGIRRGSLFYLRNSNTGGPANLVFHYGRSGDEPVAGDWNGSGVDSVGIRRGSRFFLRNSNTGGPANLDFHYGRAGDDPVAGDWNGSGVDTVGIRRGDRFMLRNSNTGGPANLDFRYGRAGDEVIVGDWNGSGTTTVGIRRITEPPPDVDPDPQVVGTSTTPLVPGQARNTNIHLAADYIDGDVIPSGGSYSLNQGIGPRTTARGFVENGFIDGDGDVISVVGGGVSQMGTTFLNAAWFTGIQIDEFRQHTIYFERYPMCREATLAWNVLDVVVTNDSPYDITIVTDHSPESVTVSFVSQPWAQVDSWIGDPYDVTGVGGAFSVDCGRTVTYPDTSTSSESYSWRYSEGFPG